MSHHGDEPFAALDEKTRDKMRETFRQANIGATGEFPQGKIAKDDEGEIAFAIGHRTGKVLIEFGKEVAWIGMDPLQVIALANSLIAHARKARIIGAPNDTSRHKAFVKP